MSSSEGPISMGALQRAWDHVWARDSAPGIDRETVEAYSVRVAHRLGKLHDALAKGAYRPRPGRRARLPHDPDRVIVVSTVRDRVVQRALAQTLNPALEKHLSDAAWGFRAGRGVPGALARVGRAIDAGRHDILRTDIRQFFDTVQRGPLLDDLRAAGVSPERIRLVEHLLSAGVLDGHAWLEPAIGLPQGNALSPLLANFALRGVDAQLLASGLTYVRYADDILVLGSTQASVTDARVTLERAVSDIGLSLSARKTRQGHLTDGFDFLGAHFDGSGRTLGVKARRALAERAAACETAVEMADLGAAWRRWYGALRPLPSDPLALIAAGALGEVTGVVTPWLTMRLGAPDRLQPVVHLAMAQAWQTSRSSDAPLAILLDARAACAGGMPSAAIAAALGWPAGAGRALELGHRAAAACFGEHGLTALARASRPAVHRRPTHPSAPPEGLTEALLGRLVGHQPSGAHLVARLDGRGQSRFVPCPRPIQRDDLCRHLQGRRRLAVHCVSPSSMVLFLVVGLGTTAAARLPRDAADAPRLRQLGARVQQEALSFGRVAQRLGWRAHYERRGTQQYRVWFFLDAPVPVHVATRALWRLLFEAGEPPQGLRRTATPDRDRYRGGRGPWVELPLGHDVRGRPGVWLDEHGAPFADGPAALKASFSQLTSAESVADLLRPVPVVGQRPACSNRLTGSAGQIASRCHVVGALCQKAVEIGHLEGPERATLFEVLGHLPRTERTDALRQALEPTGIADHEIERRLRRLATHPISCAAVRRRHPLITGEHPCDCKFANLPARAYPTPLFKGARLRDLPELRKLLKPAPCTPAKQVGTEPSSAKPRPVQAANRAPTRTPEAHPRHPPSTAAPAAPSRHDITLEVEQGIRKLVSLREHLENTQRGLLRTEDHLLRLFDVLKVDRIRISTGWLCVDRSGPRPSFRIEL